MLRFLNDFRTVITLRIFETERHQRKIKYLKLAHFFVSFNNPYVPMKVLSFHHCLRILRFCFLFFFFSLLMEGFAFFKNIFTF